jgi:hypothetical protein
VTDPRDPGDLPPAAGPRDAIDDRDEPVREGHALQTRGSRWLALLRYGAPVCAACALLLVLGDGEAQLDADLQLQLPREIAQGSRHLPLRALHYAQLRAAEGPVLVREALAVRVERGPGQVIARGRIEPARGELSDLEANLALPLPLAAGERLQVIAELPGRDPPLAVRASVSVQAQLSPLQPEGRPLRGLQQVSAGPVRAEPDATAPSALEVQVSGGACVPEVPCRVLVHVGTPAAALRVLPNSTVTPADARASAETSGVVELGFTTHGPEAELWLAVERAGQRVARRSVRLPIALGALGARFAPDVPVLDAQAPLGVYAVAADGGCIVDAFQDGHWRATGSLASCAAPGPLPFALGPGLWRVQLRRDPFSMQTAGVAVIYRRSPDEAKDAVPAGLLAAAKRSAPEDAFARSCGVGPEACAGPAALRYLSALLESGLAPLPLAQTGYAESLARVRAARARMRTLALIALALGGTGLVLSIGHSGMRAGRRVSLLLDGDPAAARRARLRSVVLVTASTGALVLVFSVLALYVAARGGY